LYSSRIYTIFEKSAFGVLRTVVSLLATYNTFPLSHYFFCPKREATRSSETSIYKKSTSQKTAFVIVTALQTSNPTKFKILYIYLIQMLNNLRKAFVFLNSSQRPDRLWDPPSLLSSGHLGALSPWVKRPRREAVHLRPASTEVKKTSTRPYVFMA
jgi:hypothetical protein